MSNPSHHKNVDYDLQEHGQRWAVCRPCGAQWSIVETNQGDDYEQVTEGDGYCDDDEYRPSPDEPDDEGPGPGESR